MMRRDCSNDYPLVGMSPDGQLPPRTVLASLEPKGLGTPLRESISSFYRRLAYLHCLSPHNLAREIIIPRIIRKERRGTVPFRNTWKWPCFSGLGTVPEEWTRQLENLTGQKDLVGLTLLPLRSYITTWGLLSHKKKWCPLCLAEAAQEGEVYEQLLWEISAVRACPKHKIKLVNRCNCNGSFSMHPTKVIHLPGICTSCGCSLVQEDISKLEHASSDELKLTRAIAELIGTMETITSKTSGEASGVALFLKGAVRCFTGGKAAHFAKILGVGKSCLHGWIHTNHVPTLSQLANIALACNCSIVDVLQGKHGAIKESEPNMQNIITPVSRRRKAARKLNIKELVKKLRVLAAEEPPINATQAGAKLDVDVRTLYVHFGDIAREMTQRFRAHIHQERELRFEYKCNMYRQSAEKLVRQGKRPTSRLVALDLKGKETVCPGIQREACARICREVIQSS